MKKITKLVTVALTLLSPTALAAAPATAAAAEGTHDFEQLGFLAGAWTYEGGATDGVIVEYWLPPLRGLMVGINRDPQGEGKPFFEYLRIEQRGDAIFMVASPNGGGTTDFELTELSGTRAVFENPEHDFPQKITYSREGDRLEAEVGGPQGGEWSSFTLRFTLAD